MLLLRTTDMRPTFRALFDSHAAYVLGRLRWLGVPERDRPDVAQEIFADVARHLEDLDPARPVRPWLLAITCNAARDHFRRAHVRREQLDGNGHDIAQENRVHDQLDAAQVVRRLLASLQYDHREVLMLVALDERPVPEVAELLGLNIKTVESRLARARAALTEAFARMRAAEARRIGPGGALSGAMLVDVDELLRAGRDVHEDLDLEVAELRTRMARALHSPAPAAAASSPAATGIGLGFFGAVAIAACVYGFNGPTAAPLSMCPVLEAVAVPASSPAAPPAPTVTALASASSAPSTSPAPAPCTRAASPSSTSPAPAEMSELELLGMARRALREGSTVRAVAWLRRHERTYPRGALAGERAAMLARLAGSR